MTVSLFSSPRRAPPYARLLIVLLYECCEADAEGSAAKTLQRHGFELCSVFERCRRSASGPAGENSEVTLLSRIILQSLTFTDNPTDPTEPSGFHLMGLVPFSPPRLHAELLVLSVQVMPVYQSCVFNCVCPPPGDPMSMCRHVCIPPISDCALILYMNYSFVYLD